MRIEPELSAFSIVMIGSLNPRIFQPEWFSRTGLINEKEIASADIQIIHAQMAAFSLDWLNIQVTEDRFSAETRVPPFVRLKDLILRTFGEFLPHTPIFKLGLNRVVHFSVGTLETRNKVGRALAPTAPWGEWARNIEGQPDKPETVGGMRSLTMLAQRTDGHSGAITVRVEPSLHPSLVRNGIFIEVNDHYEIAEPQKTIGTDAAMRIIETEGERSIERSEQIIDQIMALRDK
jgi:hypothetical protein